MMILKEYGSADTFTFMYKRSFHTFHTVEVASCCTCIRFNVLLTGRQGRIQITVIGMCIYIYW